MGLKPTYGLVPYTGIIPIEKTLDHVGPMARTVEDCATLLEVIFTLPNKFSEKLKAQEIKCMFCVFVLGDCWL